MRREKNAIVGVDGHLRGIKARIEDLEETADPVKVETLLAELKQHPTSGSRRSKRRRAPQSKLCPTRSLTRPGLSRSVRRRP